MNILIIGNGFDLAHGLPTTYGHFLKYTDAFKRFKNICMQESVKADWETANDEDKKYILHFSNMYEQKKRVFEEIDTLTSNNVWIDYFWGIYKDRKGGGINGWIDFESEISRIIQILDSARFTILEEINKGNKTGRMTQQQVVILAPLWGKTGINIDSTSFDENAIQYRKVLFLKDLNRLTRCLELYLENYVEIITPKVKLPDIEKLDIHCVLSFNYTHTYESFYHTDKNKKINYDYIHGEIESDSSVEKCNLILGIDEYLEGYAKNMDNEFSQFKKLYQRIFKKTGCKFVDWKRNAEQSSSAYGKKNDNPLHNVYIIGHSMDITDKDILSCLINMESTKTTIFHYCQEALGNQISNLVKVLGEDELISKVHGSNASIVLQKQQDPVLVEN